MIKNIKIRGFRGIQSLDMDDFKQVNFLLGGNNCGKTSILEALFLIIGIANPRLAHSIHIFRELFLTATDDFRFIFYKLDFNSKVLIEADTIQGRRSLEIKPTFSTSLSHNNGADLVKSNEPSASSTVLKEESVDKIVLNSVLKMGPNSKSRKIQSEIFIENNKGQVKVPNTYKESLQGYFINSNTVYSDLSARIENLLVTKKKDLLLEPIRSIEPRIRDFVLGTNNMIYLDLGFERMIPLNLLGDGIKRGFSILAKILDTKNGIILIDEIENGLHYSSLKVFLKYLMRTVRSQNIQLFITTHSRETLSNLLHVVEGEEFDEFRAEIKSFTVRRHEKDRVIGYPYDFEKFEHAIEQDIEMR